MNADVLVAVAREAMTVTMLVAAPIIGLALLAGILVSLFQAVTQIQEATVSFVPKILAVAVAFLLFGPWITRVMVRFTASLFDALPGYLR